MTVSGYDEFYYEPGQIKEQKCRVCGARCTIRRNVKGAVSGKQQLHDAFTCPHSEQSWHEQALALLEFLDHTPSDNLAILIKSDVRQIIAANLT